MIFSIGDLCSSIHGLSDIMKYYNEKKNALIVGSLGEGETLNMVGSLIQYGSEKLRVVMEIIEKLPNTDLSHILNILNEEQGDFSTKHYEQKISDARKREIGDKGECYIYTLLCERYKHSQIEWSNYAPYGDNDREVTFRNVKYPLKTTSHDFDFKVKADNKTYYIEVKTTTGDIKNSTDFPLIFATKEWEWIDINAQDDTSHIIVRVFDIEGNPKAYFLKQTLDIE